MIITEKMIKELQRRIDISYEEAERYLRKAGGNLDIAEAYAYRKTHSFFGKIFSNLEKLINATLIYRIRLYKNDDVFLNTPVFFFILLVFLIGVDKALFVGVVFVIIALVADCNIEIKKFDRKEPFSFYKTVEKSAPQSNDRDLSESENSAEEGVNPSSADSFTQTSEGVEQVSDSSEAESNKDPKTDTYYEVTIDK